VRLLLDTHALLWWLADDDRLGPQVRNLIEDPGNDVLVSVVSLWETVVKVRVGQLEADIKAIVDAVQGEGFVLLGIAAAHLLTLEGLPMHRRDPFDRLLISQAIAENATFISEGRNTPRYPVRFIACSDAPLPPSKHLPGLREERPMKMK
jgi:PIN domain nuclease of toxin-antitoxin system